MLLWGELDEANSDAEGANSPTKRPADLVEHVKAKSSIRLTSVDMIRLDAKFVIRNVSKGADKPKPALFSEARYDLGVFTYVYVRDARAEIYSVLGGSNPYPCL